MALISSQRYAMLLKLKMKSNILLVVLLLAVATSGCRLFEKHGTAPKPVAASSPAIVTPDSSLEAKVSSVNTVGRFVGVGFAAGQLPRLDQTFFIYRAGLKVAQVKITGPAQDNNIVADLVSGDAQVGDAVRDE
jgi:hypothetical protein